MIRYYFLFPNAITHKSLIFISHIPFLEQIRKCIFFFLQQIINQIHNFQLILGKIGHCMHKEIEFE